MMNYPGSPGVNGTTSALLGLATTDHKSPEGNTAGVAPTPEVDQFKISAAGAQGGNMIHQPVANYPIVTKG
jgi:hypothetical protein